MTEQKLVPTADVDCGTLHRVRPELGRILVIDDDPQVGTLQRLYIEEMGYQAEVVLNTESARSSIQRVPPTLLVVDYKLSEQSNGLAFYRSLLDRGLNIPAILVTALGHEDVLVEAMHLGVRGFVLKTPTYWRDFQETIERVMHLIAVEREAFDARSIKESEAKVQAALGAAGVGYWRWDSGADSLSVSPVFRQILQIPPAAPLSKRKDLLALVLPEDRLTLEQELRAERLSKQTICCEFRFYDDVNQVRWFILKFGVDPENPTVVTGTVSDVTAQKEAEVQLAKSYREIHSLNQQLQANMVETHHRVKNSLQIVGSLVNMEMRRAETFTSTDLRKFGAHIQAFATLHDILAEQSKELASNNCATTIVGAHEILVRLLEILIPLSDGRLVVQRLDQVWVSPRQSAALGLLLNELVSNAIKHGNGPIRLRVECREEWCLLAVINDGSFFPANFRPQDTSRTGLKLMTTIARVELGSELEFLNTDSGAAVQVTFKVSPAVSNTAPGQELKQSAQAT